MSDIMIGGQGLETMLTVAKQLAESDVLPQRYQDKPGNILAVIQAGAEIGLPPMTSLRAFYVTDKNELSMMAELMLGLCKSHPDYRGFEERYDEETQTYYFNIKRALHDDTTETTKSTFSMQDAQNAKLLEKTNWRKYPTRMLRARAMSFACRGAFPDKLAGIYSTEELEVSNNRQQDVPQETREPIPAKFEEQGTNDTIEVLNIREMRQGNPKAKPFERKTTVVSEGKFSGDVQAEIDRFNRFMEIPFVDRDDVMAEHVKLCNKMSGTPEELKKLKAITGKAVRAYINAQQESERFDTLARIAYKELKLDPIDFLYRKKLDELVESVPVNAYKTFANKVANKLVEGNKLPEKQWESMKESLEKEPTRKNWLDTIILLNNIAKMTNKGEK
jgi:hypothetical protein